jgi:hypothetical protein
MFKAREIYDKNGRIPSKLIKKWSEIRIIYIFLILMICYMGSLEIFSYITQFHLASYNLIEVPMKNEGMLI